MESFIQDKLTDEPDRATIGTEIRKTLDDLHELIYGQGGIRPTNAAIDEICKLIFLRAHLSQNPGFKFHSGELAGKSLGVILADSRIGSHPESAPAAIKIAFGEIAALPEYQWTDATGNSQSILPSDEPFRLMNSEVLHAALASVNKIWRLAALADSSQGHVLDLVGSVYEVFLRGKYEGAGGLGTYLTPSEVVECMCSFAFTLTSDDALWDEKLNTDGDRRPSFLVGDICCGTGRFLVSALKHTERKVMRSGSKSDDEMKSWLAKLYRNSFFGADQALSSIWKARVNFLLRNACIQQVFHVDDSITSLEIDSRGGQFSLLLTNPPFGDGKYTSKRGLTKMRDRSAGLGLGWSLMNGKSLNSADPALLFLDRNIQILGPGGKLLIVLPDGLLSDSSLLQYVFGRYDSVRDEMIGGKAIPIAVVSLPTVTFSVSGAVAKTSFLVLRNRASNEKARPPVKIFFATAEHVGFLKKGTSTIPDPKGSDLEVIAEMFGEFYQTGEVHNLPKEISVSIVSEREISDTYEASFYDFRIQKAVSAIEKSGYPTRTLKDLVQLRKKHAKLRSESTSYYISVLHVGDSSEVDWLLARTHNPSSRGQRCYPGDVLFSCINPRKTRVAVIPPEMSGEILCSTEFAVLQPGQGVDSYYLALVLSLPSIVDQVAFKAKGTSSSRRRIKARDLQDIIIPLIEDKEMKSMVNQFGCELSKIAQSRDKLAMIKSFLSQAIPKD